MLLALICAFFLAIAIIDYRYRRVLNVMTYPGFVAAVALNVLVLHRPPLTVALGAAFAFGVFYLAARVRPGGLGGGDVKLAAVIGALFGFPQVLWALLIGALASGVTIALLIGFFHFTPKDRIPYAPFLCLGAVVLLLFNAVPLL
jgi:leader peptidase (prepilin peptidase)/N-methyltransferase